MLGEINGQVLPAELPVVLLDLSAGGFAIASSVPFVPNSEYTFHFTGSRPHGRIRARDMHCLRVSHGAASASYVAGFSFLLDSAADQQVVESLVAEAHDLMLDAARPFAASGNGSSLQAAAS